MLSFSFNEIKINSLTVHDYKGTSTTAPLTDHVKNKRLTIVSHFSLSRTYKTSQHFDLEFRDSSNCF